jgi:Rod binding domain-containing protein
MIGAIPPTTDTGQAARPLAKPDPLRAAAVELEATFLAEMLKSAGFQKADSAFGGGEGEAQFASLLIREQAGAMARAGGIGLAESLYEALKEKQNAA